MYSENNKLTVVKGLMEYDEFLSAYAPHADKNAVLHFRIATHGGVNAENTHPFIVHDNLAMVHNGIISSVEITDNSKSDTWHFTEMFLKKYHDHWKDVEFQTLVESYIGHSKLILMDNTGEVKIYKEKLGNWNSECWFSNMSWQTSKVNVLPKPYMNQWSYKKQYEPFKKEVSASGLKVGHKVDLLYRTLFTDPIDPNKGVWLDQFTEVTIIWFGQGTKIGLQDPLSKYTVEVDIWKIEPSEPHLTDFSVDDYFGFDFKKGDNLVLTKNYNHFRIGTCIVADDVLQNYVLTRKPNGQFYSIPKHALSTTAALLM